MLNTIMNLISGFVNIFSQIMDRVAKKDAENIIRNGYEEKIKADALEDTVESINKVNKTKEKAQEIQTTIDHINNIKDTDMILTPEEIESEITALSGDDKIKRLEEINLAKTIHKKSLDMLDKLNNDKAFNNGDEIIFGG